MILYHASNLEIPSPDVVHSRIEVDFGPGFYTTPLLQQARQWGQRFLRSHNPAFVNTYRLDEKALAQFKVRRFDSYSNAWLEFVVSCRRGEDVTDYDIVIGGVANDRVFNTVELYFDGLIDKQEAIKRLRYEKPNLQVAFRTQTALDACLRFEGSQQL